MIFAFPAVFKAVHNSPITLPYEDAPDIDNLTLTDDPEFAGRESGSLGSLQQDEYVTTDRREPASLLPWSTKPINKRASR